MNEKRVFVRVIVSSSYKPLYSYECVFVSRVSSCKPLYSYDKCGSVNRYTAVASQWVSVL